MKKIELAKRMVVSGSGRAKDVKAGLSMMAKYPGVDKYPTKGGTIKKDKKLGYK